MVTIKKQHTKVNYSNINIPVKFIVIHDTGVPGQSAKNNADYFENTYRGASAHYFVDENEIIEVVAPGKKGWHVGDDKDDSDGINNGNTIGIEFCAEKDKTFKPETIANGQLLVRKLMKDYGVSANKVVRHYDASGKNCPQFMNIDGKWTLWKQYHKELTGAASVSVPLPSNSNKESQHIVKAGDTLWGLSKQYNATITELKKWNNLKSDIIVVGTKLNLGNNVKTPTPNPTPVASTPKATKSIQQLVNETNAGKHGNGDARKKSLGSSYDAVMKVINGGSKPASKPVTNKKRVYLPKSAKTWRVYKTSGPYTTGKEVGLLAPATYGGLDYEIIKTLATDVYEIKTSAFGNVAIYAAKSTGATIK
jgi:LysM repeat protein